MADSPPETGPAGERDVADVGRRGPGDGLVDDEGAVLEVGAALLLHLPKVLQRLHHVDCNMKIDIDYLYILSSLIITVRKGYTEHHCILSTQLIQRRDVLCGAAS